MPRLNGSILLCISALLPALALYFVYRDIVSHEFLRWDDYAYVVNNENIRSLNSSGLRWAFFEFYFLNWHPVTWLAYMIEYRLWGGNVVLFKMFNIGIHLISCYLIILLSYKILDLVYPRSSASVDSDVQRRRFAGLFAGTLFAVHPLHVESVVWVSELKDVLSGLFYFAALLAYINYRQTANSRRWLYLLVLFFLLALMSKSMAVTLPATLIVIDIFLFQRISRITWLPDLLTLIREKLFYFGLSACVVAFALVSQNTDSLAATSFLTRVINVFDALSLYLGNFIWPVNLSPFYPFGSYSLEPGIHSIVPVIIFAAMAGVVVTVDRFVFKGPLFALAFFLVAILPVIGLIKVGEQAAADRYTYIPMAMFFVAAACGIYRLQTAMQSVKVSILSGLSLALLTIGFYSWHAALYVPVWKSDETLWSEVNRLYPMQVAQAYLNLGNVEYEKENHEAALENYQTALEIDEKNIFARGNLAAANEALGNRDVAASIFGDLARLHRNSVNALNIAAAGMRRLGELEQSAQFYQQALQLRPTSIEQLFESALADQLIGKVNQAAEKVGALLRFDSEHRQGRILDVALLFQQGKIPEATRKLDVLRAAFPDDPQIRQIDLQLQKLSAQPG